MPKHYELLTQPKRSAYKSCVLCGCTIREGDQYATVTSKACGRRVFCASCISEAMDKKQGRC